MIDPNSVFAEQTVIEKYSEAKGKYVGYNSTFEEFQKLKMYLLAHPEKDKDSRELELKMINEILLQRNFEMQHTVLSLNKLLLSNHLNDKYLRSFLYYYLSFYLDDFSSLEVQKNCDNALKFLDDARHSNLKTLIYSIKAGTYYKEKEYTKAIENYKATIRHIEGSSLFKSSLLNNLSLCYFKMGDFKKSLKTNFRAINVLKLSISENISKSKYLNALLLANQGEIYYALNKIDLAKKKLEFYLNFVLNHYEFREQAPKKLLSLYKIYTSMTTLGKKREIIDYLKIIMSDTSNIDHQIKASESLIKINKLENNTNELIKTLELNQKLRIAADSIKTKKVQIINSSLLNLSISEMQMKAESEKETIKSKAQLSILIVAFLIVIAGFSFFIWFRTKKQAFEVTKLKSKQLEQEGALKEQKIMQLQQGLELKNSMNKIFVDNIKTLRKKKEVSIEQVLKELQMQLSNLVQIDKKNFDITEDIDSEKRQFFEVLKTQHPDLTKGELELCGYLRLNLSSKELASLMNSTDGTVRVNKTKLKAKLGIPREETIEGYLKNLMC